MVASLPPAPAPFQQRRSIPLGRMRPPGAGQGGLLLLGVLGAASVMGRGSGAVGVEGREQRWSLVLCLCLALGCFRRPGLQVEGGVGPSCPNQGEPFPWAHDHPSLSYTCIWTRVGAESCSSPACLLLPAWLWPLCLLLLR